MKRIFIVKRIFLVFAMLIGCLSIFAQSFQEVVYLKNGSVVRGVIIEQVPNESLKIQTADGSIFAYKMDEVLKISKEAKNRSSLNVNKRGYRPKGYRGFAEIDGGFAAGSENGDGYIGFSTSHGYQTCPYFFIGAGLGVQYHFDLETVFMPIFGNIHINFLDNRVSPFLDIKGGYSPVDGKGGYFAPSIGINYQFTPKLGINFSFGYTLQMVENEYYDAYYYAYGYHVVPKNIKDHELGFKFGLEF